MAVKVIDTSALAAVVFAEPEGPEVVTQIQDYDLVAPHLLAFELANVCLTKIRRHPAQRELLLAGYHMANRLAIVFMTVDCPEVVLMAEEKALTVYDTAYLWLAKELEADLVTLDKTLARKASQKLK